MLSGAKNDLDVWMKEFEGAKQLANDIVTSIQERNLKFPNGGPEASRVTAVARRKLGTLGATLEALSAKLESASSVSENEKNRRRDLLTAVRNRREQLLNSLKRSEQNHNRAKLLDQNGVANGVARETEVTAELDNQGILQLQGQVMEQQDHELESLEKTVNNTKHIALAINDELTLHSRLLEDLDEEVDVTHSRMRAAQKRLRTVMKKSGGWKCSCLVFLLVAILVVVILLGFKLVL